MKIFIPILILCIVALIFIFNTKSSNKHSRSGFSEITISEPFTFKTEKAEKLSIKAFELRKEKKYDKAIELYRKAIKIEPDNPKLFSDLSLCYSSMRNLDIAISILDSAISLDSEYAPFYSNRGLYYYNLHKIKEGISDLKKAIQLDSNNCIAYSNLALAYYSENKVAEACEAFKISKRLGLNSSKINYEKNFILIEMACN
jgi:tetratricopeptide (TPR) repeat protein